MTELMRIAKAYEAALFAGHMDEVGGYFTDDVVYWVAGAHPIGGEWRGREAVLRAFESREAGPCLTAGWLGAMAWARVLRARGWIAYSSNRARYGRARA